MDKGVRSNMKGKTWEDMIALDESKEVLQYALDDAKYIPTKSGRSFGPFGLRPKGFCPT